jgi:methyl-accepting chemotaxis protein
MRLRRRRYLIDKKVQLRLAVYNGVYFLIIIAVMGVGLYLPLALQLSDPHLDIAQKALVADRIFYLHHRLGPVLLIVLLVLCVHSVFVLHKIAGPLYRFRATFQQVAAGDLSKAVRIRQGDLLLNEQAKIEEMIEALRSKLINIRHEQEAIEHVIHRLVHDFSQSGRDDLKVNIKELEERHLRLKKELEYFRLSDTDVLKVGEGGAVVKTVTIS